MSLRKLDFRIDLSVIGNDGKEIGKKYCTATIEVPKPIHKHLMQVYHPEYLEDYATVLMMVLTCPELLRKAMDDTERHISGKDTWKSH